MKNITPFLFYFFLQSLNGQQLQPTLLFKIIGEDARGNKDTLEFGYHPDAKNLELDERFGEKDISNSKWTKPFEMRFLYTFSWQEIIKAKSSKRKIVRYDADKSKCLSAQFSSSFENMYIKCKYPPYKLTWDSTIFNKSVDPCISKSYLLQNDFFDLRLYERGDVRNNLFLKYLNSNCVLMDSLHNKSTHKRCYVYDPFGPICNNSPYNVNIPFSYADNSKDTLNAHYFIGFASEKNNFVKTKTDDFSFKIIGEDALGNRDTVELGYQRGSNTISQNLNLSNLDGRYGEVDISDKKWSKPFEMRFLLTQRWKEVSKAKSTKKLITKYFLQSPKCDTELAQSAMENLFIKCKHPPFKLMWDTTFFDNPIVKCLSKSYMLPNYWNDLVTFEGDIRNNLFLQYLYLNGIVRDTIPNKPTHQRCGTNTKGPFCNSSSFNINVPITYSDQSKDTLNAHYLIGFATGKNNFIVTGIEDNNIQPLKAIYPNPTNDIINIDLGEASAREKIDLRILTIFGKELKRVTHENKSILEINLSDQEPGTYIVKISAGKKSYFGRFVKI